MQSKDGTKTFAKMCKQRTHSEKTYTAPLIFLLDCREEQNIESKSYLSK